MSKEIELFRPQKHLILNHIRQKGIHKVSEYSATTMIPLMVIYTFILEDMAEYRELALNQLKVLGEFYGK